MRKYLQGMAAALVALLCTGLVTNQAAAQAKVQFIHNSADPELDSVDVYVVSQFGAQLVFDDFHFRNASDYLSLPPFPGKIVITKGAAADEKDSVLAKAINPTNSTYILILEGVNDPASFAANPEGRSTDLNLIIKNPARDAATKAGNYDFFLHHGATDMGSFEVNIRNQAGELMNSAPFTFGYSDTTAYFSLPVDKYYLDVYEAATDEFVLTLGLDLTDKNIYDNTQSRTAGTLLLSGFQDPANNQNGAEANLFVARGTGVSGGFTARPLYPLQEVDYAWVQFIQNSADPALNSVDIYAEDNLIAGSLGYQKATTLLQVPAGGMNEGTIVAVALSGSSSSQDSLLATAVPMMPGSQHIAVINGVTKPSEFKANPDGREIKVMLDIISDFRAVSTSTGEFEVMAYHGVTDESTLTVQNTSNADQYLNGEKYTDKGSYMPIAEGENIFLVWDMNTDTFGRYMADLSGVADSAGLMMLSGFGEPVANKNGDSVRVYFVLPSGRIITTEKLPEEPSSSIAAQAISSFSVYPNPAADQAVVQFHLSASAPVSIHITDHTGRRVYSMEKGMMPAGDQRMMIPVDKLSSGIYLLQMQAGNSNTFRKLSVVK